MGSITESTFQGYIASTHDALLIFECVRRGMMPKVTRRLREEERGLIRSGQVFVFDEQESGIKRWTDGLLWSPSRILWNFLVYRQIDKKLHEVKGAKAAAAATAAPAPPAPEPYHPYALGVGPSTSSVTLSPAPPSASRKNRSSSNASRPKASSSQQPDGSAAAGPSRIKSDGSISETVLSWASNSADPDAQLTSHEYVTSGMVSGMAELTSGDRPSSPSSKREADLERSLVGSLTSSYPFAKGGLCKKTISIQVEGSTQHLISYYSVEDVRAGRLRTPSSLTELNALTISPTFLSKTSFRFPPSVTVGPDGVPRYNRETYDNQSPQKADYGSSGEGTSGSDTRGPAIAPLSSPNDQFASYDADMATPNTSAGASGPGDSSWATFPGSGIDESGSTSSYSRPAPLPHQIGGSGHLPMARRSSDAALRTRKGSGRFEPYGSPSSNMAQGGISSGAAPGSGPSSLVSSPMSTSATPFQSFGSAFSAAQDTAPPPSTRPRSASNRRLQTSRSLWNLSEVSASSGAPAGFPPLPLQHAAHQQEQHHAHIQQRPMSSSEASRPMGDGFGPGEMAQRPATGGGLPWSSLSIYSPPTLDTSHAASQSHFFGGAAAFSPQPQQQQASGSSSRAEWESRASKPSGSSSGHVNYGLGAISTYTDNQQMHHSVSDQGHEHAQELQTYPRPGSSASHFTSSSLSSPADQHGPIWRPPWGGGQSYTGAAEPAVPSVLPSGMQGSNVNTQQGPGPSNNDTWPAVFGMPASSSSLASAGAPPGPSPPLYAEPTGMPIWAANVGASGDAQYYGHQPPQQSVRMSRANTNDSTSGSGNGDLNAIFLSRPSDGHH